MSEAVAEDSSSSSGGVLDGGPGLAYMPFVVMEDLLDKLKLLNYEEDFVRHLRMRPLSRHYFMLQTNPGEQFYLFSSLAAWLVRKSGVPFEQPQEFDDPNSTISNILGNVRKIGVTIDFAPSKLKQGYGEQAIFVLDRLADEALRASAFQWARPEATLEAEAPPEEEEDEAELNLDRVEEEMAAEYSDEEEDDEILHINEMMVPAAMSAQQRPEEILASTTDAESWRLEVERVAPQLRVTVRQLDSGQGGDWRAHLQQMHAHRAGIDDALATTRTHLDRLHADILRTLEKIASREKYLNSQLEAPLGELRRMADTLATAKEQYRQVSGGVTGRSRTLAQISDDLEALKGEMEERGGAMTDGAPLVSVKRALARMRQEVKSMNVRIGVVEHTVMQARLRDKSNMQRDLAGFPAEHERGFM